MDWNKVIDTHGKAFILYARQWTKSHADAEDVVQIAITRLCRSHGAGEQIPVPLIYTAIRSRALDLYRSRQRRLAREEAAAELLYDTRVFENTGEEELSDRVEVALQELPLDQREVVIMKIWGGLTFREISESLHVSSNTVTSRYSYAIKKLKASLD